VDFEQGREENSGLPKLTKKSYKKALKN